MVELFKIADHLPDKDLPRYLPELKTFRGICRMYTSDMFNTGKRLYSDMNIWEMMPERMTILDRSISKASLRGQLKSLLRNVAHEFDFEFSNRLEQDNV